MDPREEELTVRALLEDPALVDLYFKKKRWAELAALVRYARRDVPVALAQTDPALYRRLPDHRFTASQIRYVRLTATQLEDGCWMGLREFEVFEAP